MVDQYAALNRGRMHVVSAGQNDAVVLLHGWPGFWFDYRHVLPRANGIGRFIAPDFFGFGSSDQPGGDPILAADEEALATDLIELLDAFDIPHAVIVGHDIGSAVGPAVARLVPNRVRGLVLLNPTHPQIGDKRHTPEMQKEAWYQHFHLLPLAEKLIDGDRRCVELYLGHFYDHWAGRERIRPDEFQFVVDTYARPGAFASSIWWYKARTARRARPTAADPINIPTIALWGDSDPMRPIEHREGFEIVFPRSESKVLPRVGHFVPAEAPEAVVEAIATLMKAT